LSIDGTRAAAVLDVRCARPPAFGRDEHDAVRGVRPVDRGRGRVFQHRDAGDVVRVQEVQGIAAGGDPPALAAAQSAEAGERRAADQWHAVEDVERLARRIHRRRTANADREATSRLVIVHDLDASDFVLDELLGARDDAAVE
jgi:hypothetical protein